MIYRKEKIKVASKGRRFFLTVFLETMDNLGSELFVNQSLEHFANRIVDGNGSGRGERKKKRLPRASKESKTQ